MLADSTMAGALLMKPAAAAICAALAACQDETPAWQLPTCKNELESASIVWPASCGPRLNELSTVHASGALCPVLLGLCSSDAPVEHEPYTPISRRALKSSEAEDHEVGTEEWWLNLGAVAALVTVSGMMAGACGK